MMPIHINNMGWIETPELPTAAPTGFLWPSGTSMYNSSSRLKWLPPKSRLSKWIIMLSIQTINGWF